MRSPSAYDSAVTQARRPAGVSDGNIDYRELIRLAALAASSHNTQPWKFEILDRSIRIYADLGRRCPVVDPDDAHLFKSLGCAAENAVHAAAAQGLRADVDFDDSQNVVLIHLTPDSACSGSELTRAIPFRQCTKAPYDGRRLEREKLAVLERAATGEDVHVILLTDEDDKATVTDFVNRGNKAQLSDPAFRGELVSWIRSNDRQSLETGDGLSGRTSGKPSVPSWLAKWLVPLLVTPKGQMKTDAANIRSSAGIAVFVTSTDNKAAWVEVGRCYERFALQATVLGVRHAFINQPIEVNGLRPEFERWLGLTNEHAQLIIRFGTGPQMPFSVRRPLEEVIIDNPRD